MDEVSPKWRRRRQRPRFAIQKKWCRITFSSLILNRTVLAQRSSSSWTSSSRTLRVVHIFSRFPSLLYEDSCLSRSRHILSPEFLMLLTLVSEPQLDKRCLSPHTQYFQEIELSYQMEYFLCSSSSDDRKKERNKTTVKKEFKRTILLARCSMFIHLSE